MSAPDAAPARSWLFVPADRPDRFAKAAASGADRVILDLEDAVAPAAKRAAGRALLNTALPNAPVYLRVNGVGTAWHDDDLAVAAALPLRGILLPKADDPKATATVAAALPPTHRVVPIVESALGALNVLDVARAPRVERLAFGAVDFELDTGMRDDVDVTAPVRSQLVLVSRIAGIAPPLDSVCVAIDDRETLRRDADRGRRFGFAGKLCIHPTQVPAVNAAFAPSDEDIAWARALLDAQAARPRDAAFAFRGVMVDRPVLERARRILSLPTR